MVKRSSTPVDRVGAPPLVPSDQVIDFAHLTRMTLGEPGLEREVLKLFERQAAMLLARMQGAPPAQVAASAHTIVGSARGIGAWQVAQAAEAVELAGSRRDHAELARAVVALADAVEAASVAIVEQLKATAAT